MMTNNFKQPKYDLAVYIGRFQPFHDGHLEVVRQALLAAKNLIILVGSADSPRTTKNPFSYTERSSMVMNSLKPADRYRVQTWPLVDVPGDDREWEANVKKAVASVQKTLPGSVDHGAETIRTTLIGHHKDDSSYYVHSFPGWDLVEVPNHQGISATDIRDLYFSPCTSLVSGHLDLPEPVREFLVGFSGSEIFRALKDQYVGDQQVHSLEP